MMTGDGDNVIEWIAPKPSFCPMSPWRLGSAASSALESGLALSKLPMAFGVLADKELVVSGGIGPLSAATSS